MTSGSGGLVFVVLSVGAGLRCGWLRLSPVCDLSGKQATSGVEQRLAFSWAFPLVFVLVPEPGVGERYGGFRVFFLCSFCPFSSPLVCSFA